MEDVKPTLTENRKTRIAECQAKIDEHIERFKISPSDVDFCREYSIFRSYKGAWQKVHPTASERTAEKRGSEKGKCREIRDLIFLMIDLNHAEADIDFNDLIQMQLNFLKLSAKPKKSKNGTEYISMRDVNDSMRNLQSMMSENIKLSSRQPNTESTEKQNSLLEELTSSLSGRKVEGVDEE